MSSITRCLRIAAVPAMMLAFGCSSTSSTPGQMEEPLAPISEGARAEVGNYNVGDESPALLPIYFDTDTAHLQAEALDTLSEYAKSIVDHPEWGMLTIEGHCDERGSDEYNFSLGQHRASAVERRLVEMGVPRSRLVARTFGSQKPAVHGHGEEAWRFNRRSELHVEAEDVLASRE